MINRNKNPAPDALSDDATLSPTDAATLTALVLDECFTGAEDFGVFGTFIDAGYLELLAGLSAKEASTRVAGASIATHIRHTSFALEVYLKGILGNKPGTFPIDWVKDWEVTPVNDAQWRDLQKHLVAQLEEYKTALSNHAVRSRYSFRTAIAALTHTAFHLGAIQVKFDELKGQ